MMLSRNNRSWWGGLLVLAVAFLLLGNVYLSPPDSAAYYSVARSLIVDGDLDFYNEYEHLEFPANTFYLVGTRAAARVSNDWPVGTGLVWLPAFALAHGAARLAGRPDDAFWAPDGYSGVYRLTVTVWTALLALAAMLACAAATRRLVRRTRPVAALTLVLAGTPLGFYLFYFAMMSHIVSFCFVTAFLACWTATIGRTGWRRAAALGFLAGWAVLVRPQNCVVLLAPLAEFASLAWRRRLKPGAALRALVAGGAAAVAGYAPQSIFLARIYGSPFVLPKVEEMHWLRPHLWDMLFSQYHGALVYSPLLLLVPPGLVLLARRRPVVGVGLTLVLAAQVYVNACNAVWWSGGSFGCRRLVDVSFVYVVALGAWLRQERARRPWAWAAVAALAGWNAFLIVMERSGALSLEHYVPLDAAFFAQCGQALASPVTRVFHGLHGDLAGAGAPGRIATACTLVAAGAGLLALRRRGRRRRAATVAFGALAALSAGAVALLTGAANPARVITDNQMGDKDLSFHNRMLWDNWYEYGYYQYKRGDLAGAQRTYLRAFVLQPCNPRSLRYLATLALEAHEPGRAVRICRFVLWRTPDEPAFRKVHAVAAAELLKRQPLDPTVCANLLDDAARLDDPMLAQAVRQAWRRAHATAAVPAAAPATGVDAIMTELTGLDWLTLVNNNVLDEREFRDFVRPIAPRWGGEP